MDGSVFLKGEAEPGEFVRAKIERALSYDLHASIAEASPGEEERVANHG
ncbi:MAG: hypothetical protein ACREQI_16915 [Candidatus Binataceae bacterium]